MNMEKRTEDGGQKAELGSRRSVVGAGNGEMSNDWATPQEFFNELDREFNFLIDVCAEEWNAKCELYWSPDDNGLKQPWPGTCWMNPPFGKGIELWVQKAYEESLSGSTVVCLLPARTETDWFHEYCLKGEVRFIRGRLWFCQKDGKTGRPRFGSIIVVFRPEIEIRRRKG